MTKTDRLIAAAVAELEDHRARIDSNQALHSVVIVMEPRKDGTRVLLRTETQRVRADSLT